MIKFKQKQYTLQEGHYTGPKDLEEVPGALKVVGGATLAGLAAGYAADKITQDSRKPVLGDEPTSWATRGAQAGFVAGVMGKLLLNTMHNPLSSIKFQELDSAIRKEFGMYRVSGVTVGDTLENRKKMKESFVINSKELTKFKINISVAKGKLVMYTLGLTKKDEDVVNDILDYYCKKYYGMEYTSFPIGKGLRSGSWSVDIKFTNHQVAANFIVETGKTLGTQINILDNDISGDIEKLFSDTAAPF